MAILRDGKCSTGTRSEAVARRINAAARAHLITSTSFWTARWRARWTTKMVKPATTMATRHMIRTLVPCAGHATHRSPLLPNPGAHASHSAPAYLRTSTPRMPREQVSDTRGPSSARCATGRTRRRSPRRRMPPGRCSDRTGLSRCHGARTQLRASCRRRQHRRRLRDTACTPRRLCPTSTPLKGPRPQTRHVSRALRRMHT